jgi:hypothetical protein
MHEATSQDLDRLPAQHYLLAGAVAAFSSLVAVPVGFGWRAIKHVAEYGDEVHQTPALNGWLFLVLGAGAIIFGLSLAVALVAAGRSIRARRRHSFCLWVAALVTFFFPFGTLLGFHAINVLTTEGARRAFGVVTAADAA